MLALQSTPLHLRDQDKQDRRFDQPLLFSGFHPSSLHHHHHHAHSASASHNHHHPRHHSYHHPIPACLTTASALSAVLMPTATQFNQKAFFLDCDLKQDLSIATGSRIMHHSSNSTAAKNSNIINGSHLAPVATAAAAVPCPPRIQNCPNMEEPTQQTPIHKIQARISRMTLEDCAKEKIVLLLTGSFCPVHLHHTEMLEAAKIRMEQELGERGSESAIILGGFLSPSHDLYVGEKLKGEDLVLNSKERLDLCRLQTAQSDWIDVDPWESSQKEFFAYSKVTSRLQQYLQEQCQPTLERRMQALLLPQEHTNSSQHTLLNNSQQKSCFAQMVPQGSGSLTLDSTRNPSNIRVVYLCGADFVLRTGARKLIGGIVVVDRPLGAPSSNRRSILLTNSGGSISVPVSTQLDKDEEDDFASLASTSPSSVSSLSSNSSSSSTSSTTTTVITTAKQRVFRQLTQSYGSDWCESNVWWLPARSRTESEDISSTRIRGLLSDRKSCDGLLHPAVAARLLEKKARQEAA